MSGFVNLGDEWKDTKEPTNAPEGKYDLQVDSVDDNLSQAGNKSVRLRVAFTGKPEYATFFHYVPLPDKERDAATDQEKGREPGTTSKNKMLMIKRTLHLFNIKWDAKGFDPSKFHGKRVRADVKLEMPGDDAPPNSRPQNRLVLPSLPEGIA